MPTPTSTCTGCFGIWSLAQCACTCDAITITVVCGASDINGATVTIKNGSTTIASGTTNASGQVTLSIPCSGSYTVDVSATGYATYDAVLALSCGGTYTIDLCCPVAVCVTAQASGLPISGATVAVKSAGVTVATCTTDAGGCCTLDVGTAGTYEVLVAATGYVTSDEPSVALACSGTHGVQLCAAGACCQFTVTGCGAAQPGATVTFAGQTGTTDASGQVCFPTPTAGTFSYSVSQTRYATATGNVTVTACGTTAVAVGLTPAAGYHCACNTSAFYLPFPATLHGTDGCLGTPVTLTYGATDGLGNTVWGGSVSVTNSGCQCGAVNSPAVNNTTFYYYWPYNGDCGGAVGICAPTLVTVPPGSTGDNYCQGACAAPDTILAYTSTSMTGAPHLNVSSTYDGCLACQAPGLGNLQGTCGPADVPAWLCTTSTIAITE